MTSLCKSFLIVNDDVVEQQELMVVQISSSDGRIDVNASGNLASITIEDDDSKSHKIIAYSYVAFCRHSGLIVDGKSYYGYACMSL